MNKKEKITLASLRSPHITSPKGRGIKQIKKSKKQWFTLVELIVVITILAILWTIAFISFQGYTLNARDWVRMTDLNNIKMSLELFYSQKWFYPDPTNGVNMTYSWATAWQQGTFWDTTFRNVDKLDKKPVDPLTGNEYTYSVTYLKNEFQLWAIAEGGSLIGYEGNGKIENGKMVKLWEDNNNSVIANASEAIQEEPHLTSPTRRGIVQEQTQWRFPSAMEWQFSFPPLRGEARWGLSKEWIASYTRTLEGIAMTVPQTKRQDKRLQEQW